MDNTQLLLKFLKSKRIINDLPSAAKETATGNISLKKSTDLYIRDNITGMGTILKEDLENHYYITSVKNGMFGNVLTYALIERHDSSAEIVVYAHEGLVKQNLANKTIDKITKALS